MYVPWGINMKSYFNWFNFAMYKTSQGTNTTTVWMNLKNILFHKMNKSKKNISCLIAFMGDI